MTLLEQIQNKTQTSLSLQYKKNSEPWKDVLKDQLNSSSTLLLAEPTNKEYVDFAKSIAKDVLVAPPFPCTNQIFYDKLEKLFSPDTKAVLVSSTKNPLNVPISNMSMIFLSKMLKNKSKEYGHPILLICDEDYSKLFDSDIPFVYNYYPNTILCLTNINEDFGVGNNGYVY